MRSFNGCRITCNDLVMNALINYTYAIGILFQIMCKYIHKYIYIYLLYICTCYTTQKTSLCNWTYTNNYAIVHPWTCLKSVHFFCTQRKLHDCDPTWPVPLQNLEYHLISAILGTCWHQEIALFPWFIIQLLNHFGDEPGWRISYIILHSPISPIELHIYTHAYVYIYMYMHTHAVCFISYCITFFQRLRSAFFQELRGLEGDPTAGRSQTGLQAMNRFTTEAEKEKDGEFSVDSAVRYP